MAACEQLEAAGIAQYEISNFARAGFESRHNLKYWTRQPYLGFGVDAHSMLLSATAQRSRAVRDRGRAGEICCGSPLQKTHGLTHGGVGRNLLSGIAPESRRRPAKARGNLRRSSSSEACAPAIAELVSDGLMDRTAIVFVSRRVGACFRTKSSSGFLRQLRFRVASCQTVH